MKNRRVFLKNMLGIAVIIVLTFGVSILESCKNTSNTYAVNSSKCNNCKKCISVCPAGAISTVGSKAYINSSKCIGCGRCAATCPQGAISLN